MSCPNIPENNMTLKETFLNDELNHIKVPLKKFNQNATNNQQSIKSSSKFLVLIIYTTDPRELHHMSSIRNFSCNHLLLLSFFLKKNIAFSQIQKHSNLSFHWPWVKNSESPPETTTAPHINPKQHQSPNPSYQNHNILKTQIPITQNLLLDNINSAKNLRNKTPHIQLEMGKKILLLGY